MRLIDADALDFIVLRLNEEGRTITRSEYKTLDSIIYEFPTIEAEPVRRGRWIVRDNPCTNWYKVACSKCGYGGVMTWNYCTHCGAKMEE